MYRDFVDREDFSIPTPNVSAITGTVAKGAASAGGTVAKGATSAGGTVAKGATSAAKTVATQAVKLPGTIKDKALGPIWDYIKKAWGWLKYVASMVVCLCVVSCCFSLGVPQMVLGSMMR